MEKVKKEALAKIYNSLFRKSPDYLCYVTSDERMEMIWKEYQKVNDVKKTSKVIEEMIKSGKLEKLEK